MKLFLLAIELREKLQREDEDGCGNITPPHSQTSSVEGVFAAPSKASHPFRIIEQDTLSLQSINSLGRLMRVTNAGKHSLSNLNGYQYEYQCMIIIKWF